VRIFDLLICLKTFTANGLATYLVRVVFCSWIVRGAPGP
jgi:hypothetical protein